VKPHLSIGVACGNQAAQNMELDVELDAETIRSDTGVF
jgi:hypothetical protein